MIDWRIPKDVLRIPIPTSAAGLFRADPGMGPAQKRAGSGGILC
jgi:hypothetical protein